MKKKHFCAISLFTLLLIGLFSEIKAQVNSSRMYFIGNSVTDGFNYAGLAAMAASRTKTHTWSRHMIPGSPLFLLWNARDGSAGFTEVPFGAPGNAFPNYTWDAITLQPFDRMLLNDNNEGDSIICANYANLAKTKSPNVQFYIYNRYPRTIGDVLPTSNTLTADNWNTLYNRNYTGGWDGSNESRDYFQKLTVAMQRANITAKKFKMIAAGEVMFSLNNKMKAGQIPGYTKIWQVYADGIHMNNVGAFILATTFYATIYQESPVGMPVPSQYGSISASLAQTIQQTVWEVVTGYKDTQGNTWSGVGAVSIPVTGVSLNNSTLSVSVNQAFTLVATVAPSNANNQNVTWTTSNAAVATVSNGVVTGIAAGTATITVSTQDGSKTATCAVSVISSNILVTSVSVAPASLSLKFGNTSTLAATVLPANATNKTVTWSSSNTAIATVDASGNISTVAAGTATITATTQDGAKTSNCNLTVTANQAPVAVFTATPVSGTAPLTVQFNGTASYDPDAADFVLGYDWDYADGSPFDNSNQPSHTFNTAGTYVVRLRVMDNNNLRGNWVTKTITVTAPTGSTSATIAFTSLADGALSNPFNDVSGYSLLGSFVPSATNEPLVVSTFNGNKIILNTNFASRITLTKTGGGSFNLASLKYASDPWGGLADAVVTGTYTAGGTVTANISSASTTLQTATFNWSALSQVVIDFNAGTTTNYGMLDDFVISSVATTVAVTSVSVSPTSAAVNVGATISLTATVAPGNATNKNVTWTSSNTAIATVNTSGVVTGVAAGSATITVTTQDGAKTATSAITVSIPTIAVTSVSVSPTSASINVGATRSLTATVAPGNATNKNVTWTSSNTAIATVNTSGVVTGVAAGSATITVTTQDGAKTATSAITVTAISTTATIAFTGLADGALSNPFFDLSGYSLLGSSVPSATNEPLVVSTFNGNKIILNTNFASRITLTKTGGGSFNLASLKYASDPWGGLADAVITGTYTAGGNVIANISSASTTLQTATFNWSALSQVVIDFNAGTSTNYGMLDDFIVSSVATTVSVTSVSVSPTTASVNVGATRSLTATVAPGNATNKNVTWTSGNTAIATVNASGVVTGVAAGSATITVTTQDGAKTATSVITVTAPLNIPVGILASWDFATKGGQTNIAASTTATGIALANTNIGSGLTAVNYLGGGFTAVNQNTTTLADALLNNEYISFTVTPAANNALTINKVTLLPVSQNQLRSFTLYSSVGGFTSGKEIGTFTAIDYNGAPVVINVSGINSVTTSVEFRLYIYGVNNIYESVGLGEAIGTDLIIENGSTSTVAVTGVSATPATAEVTVGATTTITPTVLPATATNKTVSYSSSNTAIATVNASGVVTGVAAGSATITITTQDGAKTTTSTITVTTASVVAVTGVSISPASLSLTVGSGGSVIATVSPANAANKNVTYSSSNSAIATVNASGLVTALAVGTATITVTTQDGAKTATSAITVTAIVATTRTNNIGMNLGNPGLDYGSDKVFADAMRSHRNCSKIGSGNDNANKDANYWPTEDCEFLIWAGLVTKNNNGTYKLYFTGQATVTTGEATIANQVYNAANNQTTADLVISDAGNSVLYLRFLNTKRTSASATNTGITNVKLMRPISAGSTTAYSPSSLFMNDLITQLAPFKCIRSLGWVAANWNQDSLWSDRTTMLMARQSPPTGGKAYGWEGRGSSYESLILFANQAQKDVWLNVPHKATDDYIAKLAQLFKYGSDGITPYTSTQANPVYPPLNSNLNLYVEYSNEVWNDQFSQTGWVYTKAASTAAVKFDGNTDQYEWGMRYKALRSVQISIAFRNVFGSEMMTRVKPVMCSQKGYIQRTQQSLNFVDLYFGKRDSRSTWNDPHPVNYYIWGAGGTFYWDVAGAAVNTSTIWTAGSWNATAKFNDQWGNPGGFYETTGADAAWSKSLGLAYINYEGDMHPLYNGDEVTIRAIKSGTWDNRLKQNTLDHLNVLNQIDAELSCFLVLNATDGNDWGIRNVTNPSNSPQLDAVNQFNVSTPLNVTYGSLAPFTRAGNSYHTNTYMVPNLTGTGSTTLVANNQDYARSYAFRVPANGTYNVKVQYNTSAAATLVVEYAGNVIATYNLVNTSGASATTTITNFTAAADKLYSIRVLATAGSINVENVIVGSTVAARMASQQVPIIVDNSKALIVYPNPVHNGVVTIDMKGIIRNENLHIEILNAKGVRVFSTSTKLTVQQVKIPVASYAKGMYLIRISTKEKTYNSKFIVN